MTDKIHNVIQYTATVPAAQLRFGFHAHPTQCQQRQDIEGHCS
jgi:hypothetical protein